MRWRTVRLGELVEIIKGKKPSVVADFPSVEAPAPYVTIEAFEFGKPVQYASVDDNGVTVRNGDVVIVWDGARFGMVGNAIEGVLGSTLAVLRPKECSLNADFLRYFLTTKNQELQCSKRGSGIPHLDPITVKNLPIPLPPLDEQRRIVEILDQADRLRKLRCQADAIAERILPALFYKMFGDPVRNEKNLRKKKLGDLIKVKSGEPVAVKNLNPTDGYPVYGGNGINGYHTQYMFDDPVVVIGRVGVYCGAIYYSKPKSWVTDNALYVSEKSDELLDTYLVEALRIANLNQYAGRAGQPLISGSRIYPIEILVPPIDDQRRFSRQVQQLEENVANKTESRERLEKLFDVLLHRAFTGELTKRWREEQREA